MRQRLWCMAGVVLIAALFACSTTQEGTGKTSSGGAGGAKGGSTAMSGGGGRSGSGSSASASRRALPAGAVFDQSEFEMDSFE